MAPGAKVKHSKIWNFFQLPSALSLEANCKVCKLSIKRGGKVARTFSTSNLINHLKRHPADYERFQSTCEPDHGKQSCLSLNITSTTPAAASSTSSRSENGEKRLCVQKELTECFELQKKWPVSHPKARPIHHKIGEMIALDCEPFSIVENVGFRKLLQHLVPQYEIPSRRFITDEVCIRIFGKVEEAVRNVVTSALMNCKPLCLTTDIWSANHTPVSLMSLTLHWIEDLQRKTAMLNAIPLGEESHNATFLGEKLKYLLGRWGIAVSDIHLLLRDHAANITKACSDTKIDSRGCFIHALQLVVKDGIGSQRAVVDLIAKCRSIVGHFKHSTTASSRLKKYQQLYSCPEHRLIQDEPTRWDSTFYMVERILEQKKALVAYNCDYTNGINLLTSHQWSLLEKLIKLLEPFQQVTKECSSDNSSISDVIPCVTLLKKALEKTTDDSGVQTMKQELVKSLNTRFSDVEKDRKLVLATTLDPRYKVKCFQEEGTVARCKEWLREEIKKQHPDDHLPIEDQIQTDEQPVAKTSVFDFLSEIVETTDASIIETENHSSLIILQKYFEEPILPRKVHEVKSCPLKYWKAHSMNYSNSPLPAIASTYLAAPATSVQSERLFSNASEIYSDSRSRLLPDKAEKLLFVKYNHHYL